MLAQEYGLKFVIFSDADGYWSIEDTVRLFDRALMVVGPHGAGLSNLIYSRPGKFQNLDPKYVKFFDVLQHLSVYKENFKYWNRYLDEIAVFLVVDLVLYIKY